MYAVTSFLLASYTDDIRRTTSFPSHVLARSTPKPRHAKVYRLHTQYYGILVVLPPMIWNWNTSAISIKGVAAGGLIHSNYLNEMRKKKKKKTREVITKMSARDTCLLCRILSQLFMRHFFFLSSSDSICIIVISSMTIHLDQHAVRENRNINACLLY